MQLVLVPTETVLHDLPDYGITYRILKLFYAIDSRSSLSIYERMIRGWHTIDKDNQFLLHMNPLEILALCFSVGSIDKDGLIQDNLHEAVSKMVSYAFDQHFVFGQVDDAIARSSIKRPYSTTPGSLLERIKSYECHFGHEMSDQILESLYEQPRKNIYLPEGNNNSAYIGTLKQLIHEFYEKNN